MKINNNQFLNNFERAINLISISINPNDDEFTYRFPIGIVRADSSLYFGKANKQYIGVV